METHFARFSLRNAHQRQYNIFEAKFTGGPGVDVLRMMCASHIHPTFSTGSKSTAKKPQIVTFRPPFFSDVVFFISSTDTLRTDTKGQPAYVAFCSSNVGTAPYCQLESALLMASGECLSCSWLSEGTWEGVCPILFSLF
jgi:hypothetical protein